MPSRWLSLSIVAFWLATMGWLFWHELWPRWRPGEPPPSHIDLVEEVQKGTKLKTYWTVDLHRMDDKPEQDVRVFRASTWVDYQQEHDTFTLHAQFDTRSVSHVRPFYLGALFKFKVEAMTSEYRVDRAGELREVRAEVSVLPRFQEEPVPLQVRLWGDVRDGQLFAHCRGNVALTEQNMEIDLPPSPVSHNGSVIMPLHPVNRIHGLRPGQSWRQPLVDPFRDAFASSLFGGGVRHVNARVLPQPHALELSKNMRTICLVIEYESEGEIVGRTWVEQDSERVQQQEAILNGDTWTMKRDILSNRP